MKYGLLGEKLGHSYSKIIHEKFGFYSYDLVEIPKDELKPLLDSGKYAGFNVTIPYKKTVMPMCKAISAEATAIGSVNTLVRDGDGYIGHNTDFAGFMYMLGRAKIELKDKKVLILGSGGTCVTAKAVCEHVGAASVTIVSRSGDVTYDMLDSYRDSQVIINTTPVGMYPKNGEAAVDVADFPECESVVDVIYNPRRTKLLLDAKARGLKHTDGLPMLVAQAKAAAELFIGKAINDSETERVLHELTIETGNIILTGMPGSGKTSVGTALSQMTGKTLLDTDEMVVKAAQMSIPDIFAKYGEAKFREYETDAVKEAGKLSGVIVSTGGGAVLRRENRDALCQNGKVVLLKRPLSMLGTDGRPLSSSLERLEQMEKERMPVYESFCDICIENTATVEDAAKAIIENL